MLTLHREYLNALFRAGYVTLVAEFFYLNTAVESISGNCPVCSSHYWVWLAGQNVVNVNRIWQLLVPICSTPCISYTPQLVHPVLHHVQSIIWQPNDLLNASKMDVVSVTKQLIRCINRCFKLQLCNICWTLKMCTLQRMHVWRIRNYTTRTCLMS